MSILERLGTLIRSNLSALDAPSDPATRVDGWIASLERALREGRQERVRLRAEAKRIRSEAEAAETEAARWEERAALALRDGEEALARDALRQKLRAQRRAETLRTEAAELRAEESRTETLLERAEARLRELHARRGTLIEELRRAQRGDPLAASTSPRRPLRGLEAVTERLDTAEAELEVERMLDDGKAELEARFAELETREHDARLEEEVAALKARLARPKEGT